MARFDGVDLERVSAELVSYVGETTPKNQSSNTGGMVYITTQSAPACGRARAMELTERVRPILDALYSRWREENDASDSFEFQAERDACQRLLAQIKSYEEIQDMLGDQGNAPRLAANHLHPLVWRAASAQWATGHFQDAVLAAAKAVNSILQEKVDRRDLSELKLLREAFSEKPAEPGRTRLRFSNIEDAQTRESMRQGVQGFGAGCFQAIRNPVGHLPNDRNEMTEQETLERLAALSLLARWVDQANVERAP